MLKAVGSYIILEKIEEEETKSGIIVSIEETHKRDIAVVLHKGSRCTIEVEDGSKVMFSKYAPEIVELEGKEYMVINEEDVIAIVE